MVKTLILAFAANVLFAIPVDKEIGGIKMPGHVVHHQEKLMLNGAGIREKYLVQMYVCGLYLKTRSTDATKVLQANENMSLRLHIISGMVTTKRMQQAIIEGFEKSTNNNSAPYQKQIGQLIKAFNDPISKDDVFELRYSVKQGSVIFKNNMQKVQIPGHDFKKALFGIWLGNNPNHKTLRDQLMNG